MAIHTNRNTQTCYLLACTLSLISPLLGNMIPSMLAIVIVIFALKYFWRPPGVPLMALSVASIGLALTTILFTIDPITLATYLG